MEQSEQTAQVHRLPSLDPAPPQRPPAATRSVSFGGATQNALAGQPAGWVPTLVGTAARGVLMAPAFYLVGVKKPQRIAAGAAVGTVLVTLGLFTYHAIANSRPQQQQG